MTNLKSQVGKYRDKQTERIKHLNDAIEARKARVAHFGLRKEILQKIGRAHV